MSFLAKLVISPFPLVITRSSLAVLARFVAELVRSSASTSRPFGVSARPSAPWHFAQFCTYSALGPAEPVEPKLAYVRAEPKLMLPTADTAALTDNWIEVLMIYAVFIRSIMLCCEDLRKYLGDL